jgi:hypothetical protein
MNNEERIWELISVKLTGETTADESLELARIISGSPDVEKLMQSLELLWHPLSQPTEKEIVRAIENIQQKLASNPEADLEDH